MIDPTLKSERCNQCNDNHVYYPYDDWIKVDNKTLTNLGDVDDDAAPLVDYPSISGRYCSLRCLLDKILDIFLITGYHKESS